MKFSNFKKSNKFVKQTKQEVKVETPKLQKHDVIFDVVHLGNLLSQPDFITAVPNYINKFFFKYGNDVFYDNGKQFELLSRQDAKQLIPKNYLKEIQFQKGDKTITKKISLSEYFDNDLFLRTNESKLTINYNEDYKYVEKEYIRGFDVEYNCLNMKKDLPRNYNIELKITDDISQGVTMFFDHIKNCLCSGIESEANVVNKFLASSCMGHKVKFCLLVQTLKEQAGKGTVCNTAKDLLGDRMYKTSNPEEIVLYTKQFEGTTLINFDEVPMAGNIKTLNDCCKSLITEDTFSCRQMRCNPYQQKNTFNIIMTSNNDCVLLTQSNNIRYFVPTTKNKYAGNKEYFDKLHGYLKREDVKIAIFKEFQRIYETEIKPTNWIGNDIGTSKAGNIKIIESLPKIIKYVKKEYLMNGRDINEPVEEFINQYRNETKDNTHQSKISTYLHEDLKVETRRVNNKEFNGRKYIITYENLKQSFINKKWLLDEELEDLEANNDKEINVFDDGPVEKLQVNPVDEELKKENEELKRQIEELKKQVELLSKKPEEPQIIKQSVEDSIKRFEEQVKLKKVEKKNKSTFSKTDLEKKVKTEKAIKQAEPIEDIDDGYSTDELKQSFAECVKTIKSNKK